MEHLFAKEAARLLHDNPAALFIDCRSDAEFRFVGHPVGALNIPWNDGPGWEINPFFADQVKMLAGDAYLGPIILICRSGDRSADAGKTLEANGFSRVFAVLHGFEGGVGNNFQRGGVNGWRFDGLPWQFTACNKCGS